jgi:hypothetical protein
MIVAGDCGETRLLSVAVRAVRGDGGELTARLYRIDVSAAGRRGFVTAAELPAVGFKGI